MDVRRTRRTLPCIAERHHHFRGHDDAWEAKIAKELILWFAWLLPSAGIARSERGGCGMKAAKEKLGSIPLTTANREDGSTWSLSIGCLSVNRGRERKKPYCMIITMVLVCLELRRASIFQLTHTRLKHTGLKHTLSLGMVYIPRDLSIHVLA